jgi:diguanylate cyclase (GGDEF)-like protein
MSLRRDEAGSRGPRQAVRWVRGWHVWTLREPLRGYVLGVTALAITAIALAAFSAQWRLSEIAVFIGLLACGVVSIESTRMVKEVHGTVGRDLQSIWYLAAAITLPPVYALLAPVPMAAYRLWRVRSGFMYRRVFSNATLSLAYGFSSLVFRSIPHRIVGTVPGIGHHVLIWTATVALCALIAWFINYGLLIPAIKISDRAARIRDMFGTRESITADILEVSLAVSVTLVVAINPILMAMALPTVVLCRHYLMRSQLVANARIDQNTGLLNAGTWQREAEVELFRAIRSRAPLALAMVHIDHFGSVYETAGAAVADQLRRGIAAMLTEQLRDQDLIGRFTSEEFAILLPRTSREEARRISERLRDHIAGEPIAIESGSQEGFVFRLTVSIGVALVNESRRALAELIGAADSALNEARSAEWSRVFVLPDVLDEPDMA